VSPGQRERSERPVTVSPCHRVTLHKLHLDRARHAPVKRVIFGAVANQRVAELKDIDRREGFVLGVFALAVLVVGVYPAPLIQLMDASLANLAIHISAGKL